MEDPFYGKHTIYGVDGEYETPYMTRYWLGPFRIHIFYRGDADPDPHDHPWSFITFPLTSYVEEVTSYEPNEAGEFYSKRLQIVPAFRFSFRRATHLHRVLGAWSGARFNDGVRQVRLPHVKPGKILTLVIVFGPKRAWGFLKDRDGQWCWIPWRDYVFAGGKNAPCS